MVDISPRERIENVIKQSRKVTEMCNKYEGGMWESVILWGQVKKTYQTTKTAHKTATLAGPFGEPESGRVENRLEQLTSGFQKMLEAIPVHSSKISGAYSPTYLPKEMKKLSVLAKEFYDNCGSKATKSHKPRIKELGKEIDGHFLTAINKLEAQFKAQNVSDSKSNKEEFESSVEHFNLPGLPSSDNSSPGYESGENDGLANPFPFPLPLPGFPGLDNPDNSSPDGQFPDYLPGIPTPDESYPGQERNE
ncbi:hypothetical protein NHQ30_005557 [Ciborinia camelliae]|nr:hypothetical protein NHQ30_005557 [Ciborinia camelliae]